MRRLSKVYWGSNRSAIDLKGENRGSLAEAALLFAYLMVWSLIMATFLGTFFLIGVVTLLLVVISIPCFLWSKVSPKFKSQRPWYGANAKPVR